MFTTKIFHSFTCLLRKLSKADFLRLSSSLSRIRRRLSPKACIPRFRHPGSLNEKSSKSAGEDGDFHHWSAELERISGSLTNCIADKEPVFLRIGEQLRDFSSRSRELSGGAASLTQLVSGPEMERAAGDLERSLAQLRELGEEEDGLTQRLRTALRELDGELRQLRADMEAFRPLTKQLRMLSLYIRIESAGLGSRGGGFVDLAGQVQGLAQSTESHIGDIDRRAGETLQTVRGAASRMGYGRENRVRDMLQGVEEACGEFTTMRERAREISDSLDERTKAVAADVEDVVSAVQFHDITRQQVEHVTQVLSEVAAMLVEETADREEMLGWLKDVCRLQERQLASTHTEFTQAISRIGQSLANIAERIRSLEQSIHSLSHGEEEEGSTVLERIRDRARALVEPMRQALSFWSEVRDGMAGAGEHVRGMEDFVDRVEAISEEIKLIALNASIHAAHTGENGRSMGVLAEAVRTLSSEAGDLTRQTAERLQRIVGHAENLRAEAERARELSRKEGAQIGDLEELVQGLQAKETETASMLSRLGRESADLAAGIEAAEAGPVLEREVGGELDSAKQALQEIERQSSELAGDVEADESFRSERLREILQRYTMESERLVHMAFAGMQAQADTATDSREDAAPGSSSEEAAETEESEDLGDNVELF